MFQGVFFLGISKDCRRIFDGFRTCFKDSFGDFRCISEDWMLETTLAKVVDLVPLGAAVGPRAPNRDLGNSQITL